jgi:hypothetical protein
MKEIWCSPKSAVAGVQSKPPMLASKTDPGGKPAAVITAPPEAETRKCTTFAGTPATLAGASRCGPEAATAKLSRTVESPELASRIAFSPAVSGSAATWKRMVVWPGSESKVLGTLSWRELLVREIAAAREVPEGDNRRSHTPLNPDAMRLAQESDRSFGVAVKPCTVNVKVCLKLPDVAMRITPPVRALVVVKDTGAEVAFMGMVSDGGIENAGLLGFSVMTVGKAWGVASETTHVPEIKGVRTAGVQDSDIGDGAGADGRREMAAVKLAAPRVAVMTAACEVAMAAVEAVKMAEAAPAGTVKIAGTVRSDGRLLERETATPGAGAAFERVIVHVVLALEARLAAAHLRLERVTEAVRESVVVTDEPFHVAVTVAV